MVARDGPGYTTIVSGSGVVAWGSESMARFGRAWLGIGIGAAVALATASSGCGGPPPSPASKAARGNIVRAGTKALEVVTIPRPNEDAAEAVKAGALVQAGLDTVAVQFAEPGPGEQAEAVRAAIRREPPAIIVEAPAEPDAELDAAVAEARAKGLLVVALGRSLGGDSAGPGREVVIAPTPFKASADRIVELAMHNATNGGLDPKSGALVVVRPDADPFVADRDAALKEALRAAGAAKVEALSIDGDATAAEEAVAEAVKAHPEVSLVLGADGSSLSAADRATGILKTDRPFIVAGYTGDETNARNQTKIGEYAAAGIYAHDRLFRKAVYIVARSLRGEQPADRVEIDTPLLQSHPEAALPKARTQPPVHKDATAPE
jgi:ABC-type sugar transport system substrate-binding protein